MNISWKREPISQFNRIAKGRFIINLHTLLECFIQGNETFWIVIFEGMTHIQNFIKKGGTKHFRCFISTLAYETLSFCSCFVIESQKHPEKSEYVLYFCFLNCVATMISDNFKFPLPSLLTPNPQLHIIAHSPNPSLRQSGFNRVFGHGGVRWPVITETNLGGGGMKHLHTINFFVGLRNIFCY